MADANIGAELASLPLGSMISGPLNAAIEAQALAADTTVQFIQKVGLDNGKVRNVSFTYNTPGGGQTQLDAPILTIVPIPFIRIKDMTVDFVFKINTVAADTSKSSTNIGVTAEASGGFGPVKFGIKASFSHEQSSESKSSVDKSAELKMHVNAAQDDMPEGLKIVLSAITGSLAKAAEAQAAPAK
ncbi:MAG: DUF2589 domain-containing protein [Thaumarchaeota archaeon]|nr:DUF2589 domain-containing protein [Nitrososphaerota archaeon]